MPRTYHILTHGAAKMWAAAKKQETLRNLHVLDQDMINNLHHNETKVVRLNDIIDEKDVE